MNLNDFKETRTREGMIQIRVTPEEKRIIKNRADSLGMPIAPYARQVCMNPQVIDWNWDALGPRTEDITTIKNFIGHMTYGMRVSGQYKPEEIGAVLDLMREISRTEKELLGATLDEIEKINKQARRKQLVLPQGSLVEKPEPDDNVERLKHLFDDHAAKASNAYRDLVKNPTGAIEVLMAGFWAGSCYALGKTLDDGTGNARRIHMAEAMLARLLRGYKVDPEKVMKEKGVK